MNPAKRTTSMLALTLVLAAALVGPGSTASAIKGERPGTVTISLRAPEGYEVNFSRATGDFTLEGRSTFTVEGTRGMTLTATPAQERVAAIKGHRTFVSLQRIIVTAGGDCGIDLATATACVLIDGGEQTVVRYMYR